MARETNDYETDHWEALPSERRKELLSSVDSHCDAAMMRIDNDLSNIFSRRDQLARAGGTE